MSELLEVRRCEMGEKKTVYLETTIPCFLTARPSNNLVVAGKQEVTRQWWETRREKYQLFISQYVLDEAIGGDESADSRRIDAIRDIDVLEVDEEVIRLTAAILSTGLIPAKAQTDAAHMAVAARHGIDFSDHMELRSHCERGDSGEDQFRRCGGWLRPADRLHAGRTFWR